MTEIALHIEVFGEWHVLAASPHLERAVAKAPRQWRKNATRMETGRAVSKLPTADRVWTYESRARSARVPTKHASASASSCGDAVRDAARVRRPRRRRRPGPLPRARGALSMPRRRPPGVHLPGGRSRRRPRRAASPHHQTVSRVLLSAFRRDRRGSFCNSCGERPPRVVCCCYIAARFRSCGIEKAKINLMAGSLWLLVYAEFSPVSSWKSHICAAIELHKATKLYSQERTVCSLEKFQVSFNTWWCMKNIANDLTSYTLYSPSLTNVSSIQLL